MNETIGTPRDTAYIADRYLEGLEYSQRVPQAAWLERYGEDIDIELITGPVSPQVFRDLNDLEEFDPDATNQIEEFELSQYDIKKLRHKEVLEEQEYNRRFWARAAREHREFVASMRETVSTACHTKEDLYGMVTEAIEHDQYMAKWTGQSFWDSFSELESAFLNKEEFFRFKPVFVKVGTFIYRAETEFQLADMVAHGGQVRGA
jgi:hypothetical protein